MSGVLTALIGVALAGLALWILQPLRLRAQPAGSTDDVRWKELADAKHAIYRSILDLEFDRSVGKVSDDDCLVLRRQHEADALEILRQMDALQAGGEERAPEDALEAEIAAARARPRQQT